MADTHDEQLSGDLPATPTTFADDESPSVSHEVIASYVADAARSVRGIIDLHTSPWKGLSSRRREMQTGGVTIKDSEPGTVDVEIHVRVAWGSAIPELARQVEKSVREQVVALLNIDLGTITLFVEEIAGPMEVGSSKEG
jgi:uncharacterized alkaline shock family protein YloU